MKSILHGTLIFIAILVASCGDLHSLERLESAATALKKCEVHQTVPGECVGARKAVEELSMRAIQSGIDQKRIYVSIELGERAVEGNPLNSPYQRVTRAYKSSFSETPIRDDFELYTTACEPKNEDPATDLSLKPWEQDYSYGKWFKYFGQVQHGDRKIFVFYKTDQPCRPESYVEIDDQFAVVGNGYMLAHFSAQGRKFPNAEFGYEAVVVNSQNLAATKLLELKTNTTAD